VCMQATSQGGLFLSHSSDHFLSGQVNASYAAGFYNPAAYKRYVPTLMYMMLLLRSCRLAAASPSLAH
jgi:hypothetical protein